MKIVNGILFTESGFYRGTLQVENGGIVSIAAPSPEDGREGCVDAAGGYVLPGLLDIHIHGYAGCDASDPDPQALRRMARAMAREGVTGFLGTTMALPRSELRQAAGNFAAFRSSPEGDGAVLWGMHMEGPFFSRGKRGAQAESSIVPPDIPLFEEINRASGGMIRLVDVAPELPGALPFIRRAAQTCAVSLAHTEADYDTAAQALRQGADHITHLYNAMPPYAHRAPGVIGAAADFARYCELIGDGVHLHPAVVRQTFSFFGGDRICLISDCMRAGGLPDGAYTLGGQAVRVENGKATLPDGTLAGSVVSLSECLRRVIRFGVPAEQAIRSATLIPAQSVGLGDVTGSLRPGKRADLVVMDAGWQVRLVMIGGRIVHRA